MPSSRALLLQRDTEVRSPPPLPRAPCAPWSIGPFHPALGWELASAGWPLPRVCAIRLNTCDGNGKSAKSARCCIACVASQAWGRAGRRCRARWCLWHSAGTRHQRLHRPGTRGCWPLTSQCSVVCQRCCEQGLPSPLSASLSEPILPTALPLLPFQRPMGWMRGELLAGCRASPGRAGGRSQYPVRLWVPHILGEVSPETENCPFSFWNRRAHRSKMVSGVSRGGRHRRGCSELPHLGQPAPQRVP